MDGSGRESTVNLAGWHAEGNRAGSDRAAAAEAVAAIHGAYDRYKRGFERITRRARERFERRAWLGAQADATERLTLYKVHLDGAVADVRDLLQDAVMERTLWAAMKAHHAAGAAGRPDAELAQTFFNSVTRRVFSTVGVDPSIEYLGPDLPAPGGSAERPLFDSYRASAVDAGLVRRILETYAWSVPYAQLGRDAALVAQIIQERVAGLGVGGPLVIEMLGSVFYRNKGAYLVGRLRAGGEILPLVLPLIHA
ncbi:MAG: isocitrate dehydrogenase kinase/phosphatase AceK regulatory subunit, partial [Gammaproteobacteria bacterium]